MAQNLKITTLCFPLRKMKNKQQLLLAMKKRGFGKSKWNGMGGKKEPRDDSVEAAVVRETYEEVGVKPISLQKVAVLTFIFSDIPKEENWNQEVHTYFTGSWEGEPVETEEMAPQWFDANKLPFDTMWEDDIFWLPRVIAGKKLKATFWFACTGKEIKLAKHEIQEIDNF